MISLLFQLWTVVLACLSAASVLSACEFGKKPPHLAGQVANALLSEDDHVYLVALQDPFDAVRKFGRQFEGHGMSQVLLQLKRDGHGEDRPRWLSVVTIVASTDGYNGTQALRFYNSGFQTPPDVHFRQGDIWFGVGKIQTMKFEGFDLPVYETDLKGRQIVVVKDENTARCIKEKIFSDLIRMKEIIKSKVDPATVEPEEFSPGYSQLVWAAVLRRMEAEKASKASAEETEAVEYGEGD